jgi:hypothetical protein
MLPSTLLFLPDYRPTAAQPEHAAHSKRGSWGYACSAGDLQRGSKDYESAAVELSDGTTDTD